MVAGRVRVNGRVVTELGTKVDADVARVEVDGRRLVRQPFVYVLLNKPRGCVSTLRDPEGRETVAALVADVPARLVPVGRLDYASSGVLLMTNDGDFTAKLLHPSGGAKKIYHVKIRGKIDEKGLERWRRSIDVQGHRTRPAEVRILEEVDDKTWLEIGLHEGRNRQIRRMGDEAGHPVLRLIRVEYAGLTVDGLRTGQWRYLSKDELLELRHRFGVPRHMPHGIPAKPEPSHGRRAHAVKPSPSQRSQRKGGRDIPDTRHSAPKGSLRRSGKNQAALKKPAASARPRRPKTG
jgi:23S rRNA pseudouridine2605 synthase